MTKNVILDEKNQLIQVRFTAESTVADWRAALKEVVKLSKEKEIYRVLVDVREQTSLAGTFDLFDFASSLPNYVAFAVLCELHSEEHRFIENVATNRGKMVKDFDSEQNAIEWLKNFK